MREKPHWRAVQGGLSAPCGPMDNCCADFQGRTRISSRLANPPPDAWPVYMEIAGRAVLSGTGHMLHPPAGTPGPMPLVIHGGSDPAQGSNVLELSWTLRRSWVGPAHAETCHDFREKKPPVGFKPLMAKHNSGHLETSSHGPRPAFLRSNPAEAGAVSIDIRPPIVISARHKRRLRCTVSGVPFGIWRVSLCWNYGSGGLLLLMGNAN